MVVLREFLYQLTLQTKKISTWCNTRWRWMLEKTKSWLTLTERWPDKIYSDKIYSDAILSKYVQVLHQIDVIIGLKYSSSWPIKGHQSFLLYNPLTLPDYLFWFGYYIMSQLIIKLTIFWCLTGPNHNPNSSFGQDLSPFEKLTSFLYRTDSQSAEIFFEYILSEYILSPYRTFTTYAKSTDFYWIVDTFYRIVDT